MNFLALLLFLLPFDSGVKEKTVVVDYVDMVEINHKYFTDSDSGEVKKQFTQVIFWEYRKNVLLPEIKEGELTGNWYQGSDYVVIDYFTFNNQNYGLNKVNGIAPYLYRDRWYTHYYDQSDKCDSGQSASDAILGALNSYIERHGLDLQLEPHFYVSEKGFRSDDTIQMTSSDVLSGLDFDFGDEV